MSDRNVERGDVALGLHQRHRLGDLAHRALDLRMAGMADEDEPASLADITLALIVHLGDQRAGGVEHRQLARSGFFLDALGDAMGAEDGDGIGGNFGEVLDKARALGLEALHHMLVVHDFVTHIDRRAVFLQRPLDDLDGAHDAGAKTAGLGENHFHQRPPGRSAGFIRLMSAAAALRRNDAGHRGYVSRLCPVTWPTKAVTIKPGSLASVGSAAAAGE